VAAAAYAAGCRLDWVTIPGVGPIELGALSPLLTALWFVGVINAINLIDGLDGLAAGIVCFAALTNFVVGYLADAILPCLLSAAIAGSTLGFLAHNTHPARIFMGDSGSYFLGFVLAASSLLGFQQKASTAIAIAVPVLSMGVPIFDTLFAMVRRVLRRQPLMSADRGHVHHRLLDMGITHRHVVVVLYGVSALFTGLALMVALQRNRSIGLALAGASLLAIAGWSRVFGRRRRLIQEAARTSSRPAGVSAPAPSEPPAPTLE
jgi:UDP-GlcNAc:undecaprenyl-phosphate GlcNAc-1-phosphate transferase